MKYIALSETGEPVIITITPVNTSVTPTPAPAKELHNLRVNETADLKSPSVQCSCGSGGYICKKCMKVMCNVLSPSVGDYCPGCATKK